MKMFLLAVKDRKAQVFTAPWVAVRLEAGIRAFSDGVNNPDPNNMWAKHPADFELYHVGSFDDQTAKVESLIDLTLLGCGDEYVRQARGGGPQTADMFESRPNGA